MRKSLRFNNMVSKILQLNILRGYSETTCFVSNILRRMGEGGIPSPDPPVPKWRAFAGRSGSESSFHLGILRLRLFECGQPGIGIFP